MSDDNGTSNDGDAGGGPDTSSSNDNDNGNNGGGEARQFQAITTQEDLDRVINRSVARAHAKYADYDELKEKAQRQDALEAELASESEKAARAARDEERGKARSEYGPRLVRQAFRAEAKGVLESAQLSALLEDLDLGKYLTDKGEVDEDKVAKKIAALAPKKNDRDFPDLGAGRRGGTAKNTSMSAFIRDRAGVNQ